MDKKIKHLEMIQGIINRLANNSFLLKGWALTLITALAVYLLKKPITSVDWYIVAPLLLFWFLDAYYLMLERAFRNIYNSARLKKESEIDFSMEIPDRDSSVKAWLNAFFSITLVPFYGSITAGLLIALHLLAGK